MLYRERMRQANREAKVTIAGVAVVIVCWLIFGFGLYGIDITIFSTPLWIIMGCLGTWLVAMVVSIILATKVIEDCPLDEDDFGRKYQMEDATPVEVSPMMIDHDIMRKAEKNAVHPRKPVSNTAHHTARSADEKKV
jgi:uncharacterized membrane protein YhdT